ncbi:MAG: hypothetical protein NXY57DRAFT_961931 [Lentinula lateritia]|uniref:Uncharacterized protein n=1 Tax=Lentinula lateritia TaxID=40482 RepID=A0ABQ8UYM5_9AGAR|nr:MAG: hypothetical protein NXY57DRAFT_961931 [Lentinula lateritia]KAJ4466049.1 hypothetical protein C8R41DRAFT_871736 [Lentinula lateritia]
MDSSSPTLPIHHLAAAGPAPRRPTLPRILPALHADSSASLLTCISAVPRGDKTLPSRPVSNLRDYMPPSASRSSWSGMPFAQFERRLLYLDQPGDQPDVCELQAFLTSRIEEMNRRRQMLSLPVWKVPMNDLSLMRHVCKLWWGEDVKIPEVKKTGIGREVKYEIDYESMATAREMEEILLEKPLIEISTKDEQEEARKVEERRVAESKALMKFYSKRYGPYGVEKPVKISRKDRNEPSVFVEFWGHLGGVFGLSTRVKRRKSSRGGCAPRQRTRLGARVFRRRRQNPMY